MRDTALILKTLISDLKHLNFTAHKNEQFQKSIIERHNKQS